MTAFPFFSNVHVPVGSSPFEVSVNLSFSIQRWLSYRNPLFWLITGCPFRTSVVINPFCLSKAASICAFFMTNMFGVSSTFNAFLRLPLVESAGKVPRFRSSYCCCATTCPAWHQVEALLVQTFRLSITSFPSFCAWLKVISGSFRLMTSESSGMTWPSSRLSVVRI